MHFHLSANAAQDLKIKDFAPTTEGDTASAQHWYVHRVIVQRRKQVIAMEAQSRYALVFCGVTKPFFDDFTGIFADTLWRHISLQAHIKDAAMQMEWRMEFGELPPVITDPGQLLQLSFFINQTPRTRHGEKQCIFPYKEFQRQWLEKLALP